MSKSGQLRLRDVRDAYRLIGDCRDLGTDPMLWHGRMLQGLSDLIGATGVTGGEGRWRRPGGAPSPVSGFIVGLDTRAQHHFKAYLQNNGVADDPVVHALRYIPGSLVVRTRAELVTDSKWYRSRTFNEYLKPVHFDNQLMSVCEVSTDHAVSVLSLHRALGDRDFSERERRLVRFFHGELGRLIGTVLVSVFDPDPLHLPRRQRETLACLLEGDSEKQVATRLGVSHATAHQYVTSLYRRFAVRSRAELLAYFLRRRKAGAKGL